MILGLFTAANPNILVNVIENCGAVIGLSIALWAAWHVMKIELTDDVDKFEKDDE